MQRAALRKCQGLQPLNLGQRPRISQREQLTFDLQLVETVARL